ncbi:MAG TPA: hypothetical protein VK487_09835 [Candidatus Bathyarchaeia archaeon]|nr:hypothetical protein [Candidatus Bathyarchaeia archaeon]
MRAQDLTAKVVDRNQGTRMEILNEYIAPWVLPKQVFPIHCVWKPERDLSKIVVTIPQGYKLHDTLNFTNYIFDETKRTIFVGVADLKSNNYFGIVLRYGKIIDDVEQRDAVVIDFQDTKGISLKNVTLYTRIVRPKLEFVGFPEEIVVTNSTNLSDLITLEILHKGFGTANTTTEVLHSGGYISKSDSLYFKVLRETIERILKIYDEPLRSKGGIELLDDELVRKVADEILKSPTQENLPFELDKEEIELLREIMKDKAKQEEVYRVVYSSLRSLVLAALLYYGEKHPVEDIKMVDGKVVATIKQKTDELVIRVRYSDSLDNEYQPIEVRTKVIDRRDPEKQKEFETPINIVWKKDILKLED